MHLSKLHGQPVGKVRQDCLPRKIGGTKNKNKICLKSCCCRCFRQPRRRVGKMLLALDMEPTCTSIYICLRKHVGVNMQV